MMRPIQVSSLVIAGLMAGLPAVAGQRDRLTLPTGTVIPVQLEKAISSKTAKPGDKVIGLVVQGPEAAGIPAGSRIEGVVKEAIPAQDGKPGLLDIDFRKLVIEGDDGYTIDGTLASLDAKAIKKTESGRLEASGDKSKDRMKWVGIGAGAGLLVSTLTKGNTLVNTVLGAGAGYLFNELSKKKVGDVNLKEGTKFGIRIERQVSFATGRSGVPAPRDDEKYFRPGNRDKDRDSDPVRKPVDERDPVNAKTAKPGEIGVLLDDREVKFGSAKPFARGNVIYVPLDAAAKSAKFGYDYDAGEKLISSRKGDIELAVGSRIATVNGERRRLSGKAEVRDGVVFVPADFLGIAFNGSVEWDASSKTVIISRREE